MNHKHKFVLIGVLGERLCQKCNISEEQYIQDLEAFKQEILKEFKEITAVEADGIHIGMVLNWMRSTIKKCEEEQL